MFSSWAVEGYAPSEVVVAATQVVPWAFPDDARFSNVRYLRDGNRLVAFPEAFTRFCTKAFHTARALRDPKR